MEIDLLEILIFKPRTYPVTYLSDILVSVTKQSVWHSLHKGHSCVIFLLWFCYSSVTVLLYVCGKSVAPLIDISHSLFITVDLLRISELLQNLGSRITELIIQNIAPLFGKVLLRFTVKQKVISIISCCTCVLLVTPQSKYLKVDGCSCLAYESEFQKHV